MNEGQMRNEKRTEMRAIKVDLLCSTPDCYGVMVPDGITLTMNPPVYPHHCEKCGKHDTYVDRVYPYIDYEALA